MKKSELQAVLYLWTRDAKMPVDADTEAYIADHFEKLRKKQTFSDPGRAEMAERLAERFKDEPKIKKAAPPRPKDPAYETFKAIYAECRGLEYRGIKADGIENYSQIDFIKLHEMRRRLTVAPGELPSGWDRTCRNYLTSDYITRFTLMDLCIRIDIFMRGPIRRKDAQTEAGKFINANHDGKGIRTNESGTGTETRTARGERTFTKRPGA